MVERPRPASGDLSSSAGDRLVLLANASAGAAGLGNAARPLSDRGIVLCARWLATRSYHQGDGRRQNRKPMIPMQHALSPAA